MVYRLGKLSGYIINKLWHCYVGHMEHGNISSQFQLDLLAVFKCKEMYKCKAICFSNKLKYVQLIYVLFFNHAFNLDIGFL
jgi:hypothetical protein